ncbi:MAG: HAD family hydrolase [Chloroflexota bacterium]|nr:HAD family hydrolase [Chloroflexota bacterium]MDE2883778.1 HAD family hydrolase [Chloroflexota bacterium]
MSIPFRAIVFDFDGLIVDSEQPIYEAYRTLFAELGATLPLSVWQDVIGSSTANAAAFVHLENSIGRKVDREAMRQQARAIRGEGTLTLPPREGVAELISEAKQAGLTLAVASSSTFAWVNGHLDRLGLLSSFDALCTREDVEETKPHPALYQLALERLGMAPHEAFAIEDSPNGVTAAKSAGLRCVAAPNPITAGMDLRHADHVLPSLAGVSLAQVVAGLVG